MKPLATVLVIALLTTALRVADADPGAARDAVKQFASLAKAKDLAAAKALLEPLTKPIKPTELDEKLARISATLAQQGVEWNVVDGRVDGTTAVVIVDQTTQAKPPRVDIDPLYLVLRKDQWKVLLDDPDQHGLSAEELDAARRLSDWYKQRKQELRRKPAR